MFEFPTRLLARTSEPAIEPVSLAEAKLYLRIDSSDEDTLIEGLIAAARLMAEEMTGRSLVTQGWGATYGEEVPAYVPLPFGPVQSITAVALIDEAGDETLMDASGYSLNAACTALCFEWLPDAFRTEIRYVTGYGDAASDVPADIRQGILLHVAWLYEHRDSMVPPNAVHTLYARYREVRL
jgi:uncharacterized phiE125 gp8 family phage protein